MARVTGFFSGSTPAESPTPAPIATATATETPSPAASPVAEETTGHAGKKTARQARAASENAAAASKAAANASAQAALASKQAATASRQAASVANQVEGSGPTNADVSLEPNPVAMGPSTPALARPASTPRGAPSVASIAPAPGTYTVSSPALESSGTGDANPAKAAKLIQDVDKVEKQVDRKNLSADDSQRDILAQKLLSEAKEALAERDSVAAISLATKASTLLSPLPKLADSAIPSLP